MSSLLSTDSELLPVCLSDVCGFSYDCYLIIKLNISIYAGDFIVFAIIIVIVLQEYMPSS